MADTDGTGTDQQKYTFDRLGRKLSATDQRGCVHEYAFDTAGRLSNDAVTTPGTNVDTTVLRIGRSYDGIGRLSFLTSYDAATGGNTVNEVKYEFDSYGNASASKQAHTGAVDGNTPAVSYTYADGASAGAAKFIRLTQITYPAGRNVYRNFPTSGIGEKMSRLDNIAADSNGTTKYAQYTYLGAGTVVKSSRPSVTGGLNLNYGTAGSYPGLDKFGRVIDQKWEKDDATVLDRVGHGYDRNSNRLYRQNLSPGGWHGRILRREVWKGCHL